MKKLTFDLKKQNIINKKTKKDVITEFITVTCFILLSLLFKVAASDLHIISSEERKVYNRICHSDILDLVQDQRIIKYDNPMVYDALIEISENPVGAELLRLIATKIEYKEINPISICQGENNVFLRQLMKIHINFDFYTEDLDHRNRRYVFAGLDQNMRIRPKFINLADTIFHELCHALHALENTAEIHKTTNTLGALVEAGFYTDVIRHLYTNDEEYRTISGIYMRDGILYRDLISCYGYDQYKSMITGEEFLARILHTIFDQRIENLISSEYRSRMDYSIE
jgi:hypothetical protein